MSSNTRPNADTTEIINALIDVTDSYIVMDDYGIDAAIEAALDVEVDYHFMNSGNSWQRTTGNRYGITAEQLKAAVLADKRRPR